MSTPFLFALSIAAATTACSVLIDVDGKQCEVNEDCAARGFLNAECRQNLCVTAAVDPGTGGAGGEAGTDGAGAESSDPLMCKPETSAGPTVKFTFAPSFASPPANPTPFSVKACQQFDLNCDKPLAGPLEVEAGKAQDFEVPVGFIGYFDIVNKDTLRALYFMGRAVNVDSTGWALRMPDEETVKNLGFFAQQDVDFNLGIVLALARDCNAQPLAGATFSSTSGGDGFYFVNDLPSVTSMKTGPQGAAGYVNVPIGTSVLNVVAESGQELKPVTVRLLGPNVISFVEVFP